VTGGIGVVVISGIEAVGWKNRVPCWTRRARSLPVEAITAAVLLWSWGFPVRTTLAIETVAFVALIEATIAARTLLWARRLRAMIDRRRGPTVGPGADGRGR
jgi:hypothetical protein